MYLNPRNVSKVNRIFTVEKYFSIHTYSLSIKEKQINK